MAGKSRFGRRYVLIVLMLVGTLNHLDRHILSILLEKIRIDLVLTDTQLGILSGLAFGLVYALMGVPISLLAAYANRKVIIAVALTVWSSLTFMCGLAQNFWQLALARLGVGIGEAGGTAPSHSMISDLYPAGQRGGAMALFSASANFGFLLAMLIGAGVAAALDWRWAFVAAGVPGLLMMLVLVFTVKEPDREAAAGATLAQGAERSRSVTLLRETIHTLWRDRCLRNIVIAAALNATVTYGFVAWVPSYLQRIHELSLPFVGLYLALVLGVIGAAGTILGGVLADRLSRRNVAWYAWVMVGAILVGKPFMFVFLLTDMQVIFLGALIFGTVFGAVYLGPTISLLHDRTPTAMRPVASALLLFVVNLVGLGVGPLLVGVLSDAAYSGSESLRYAMATAQLLGIWAAFHYWRAGRALHRTAAVC